MTQKLWFSQVPENIKKGQTRRQEIKGKNCAKKSNTGDFLSTLMHNVGREGGNEKWNSRKRI
jgi:hypothetical protein